MTRYKFTKYKHPLEYIPCCVRLFFYFSVMAWVSLFNPEDGQELIELIKDGRVKRREDLFKSIRKGVRYD